MDLLLSLKDKLKVKPTVTKQLGIKITLPTRMTYSPMVETQTVEELNEFKHDIVGKKVTYGDQLTKERERLGRERLGREQTEREPKKREIHLDDEEELEIIKRKKKKRPHFKQKEPEEEEEEEMEIVQKKMRPPTRGVITTPSKDWKDIGDTRILERVPTREPPNIRISHFYLNNREKFVNYINSIFQPYRQEFLSDRTKLSCTDLSNKAQEFRLLQHQRLVRDYMNLYTPYRGLLLYHGLGSGKTCTSIAIAEGMKTTRMIMVLTPAALKQNYIDQLQFCGDPIYKKNQYWEWISITEHPDSLETLSSALGITAEYIEKNKGAWLTNVKKSQNYETLSLKQRKAIDAQILLMIKNKYTFISYNGLRKDALKKMTSDFRRNIFDNTVVIIDEAHNFVSRIVNKLSKVSKAEKSSLGQNSLAMILYESLLTAKNARIIMLTGTPIINYPNELGILFNILRGYIKAWEIPIDNPTNTIKERSVQKIFENEKFVDYIQFSRSNVLTVTRNPLGFTNSHDRAGYQGVTSGDEVSDDDFERRILDVLRRQNINVIRQGIRVRLNKALPDNLEDFSAMFIDADMSSIKNEMLLKRRIIGLTSYFKSAQEELMPKYDKREDLFKIEIPMSPYQFTKYSAARDAERKQEKNSKKNKGKAGDLLFGLPTSTYRIFSRLYCNFVMPDPPGRPLPKAGKGEEDDIKGSRKDEHFEEDSERSEEYGDETYNERIQSALAYVKDNAAEIISTDALQQYSPKYLAMLNTITNEEHRGLHLVYSQFRTFEGIGLFKLVLEYHGFAQFKLKNVSGAWEIDIKEEDMAKPKFGLYTGTESAEEKEMIRLIFNSEWDPKWGIHDKLREMHDSNMYGDVMKVLMITASGSEGINLRNVRYVHIMEPYWNPTRLEQVIGRARRICSHTDLPEEDQTINVFIYLMTFTFEQMHGEANIELQTNDLSKRMYLTKNRQGNDVEDFKPLTSDETLFEISSIKEGISMQLVKAVKEASIDCSIYSKEGSEPLRCLNFGEPTNTKFAYSPDFLDEEKYAEEHINKVQERWEAISLTLGGVTYASRRLSSTDGRLYDLESYKMSLKDSSIQPVLVATYHISRSGDYILEDVR